MQNLPPPPGDGSRTPNRYVRPQHRNGEGSPGGISPNAAALDATQRPPPPPLPPGESAGHRPQPRGGVSPIIDDSDYAPATADFQSPGGGRKLRALRRVGSFDKLTSVPERLQQWFDGCYSSRYHATSAVAGASSTTSASSQPFADLDTPQRDAAAARKAMDASIQTASLQLHAKLATFALTHCFDSELFDVPEGVANANGASAAAAALRALSTTMANGGGGVDHRTKAIYDKWCELFDDCLTTFVSGVLHLPDDAFAATLEIDKKEEEGAGEINLFGGGSNSPIHDLKAAIAPLSNMLEKHRRTSPSMSPNHRASPSAAAAAGGPSPSSRRASESSPAGGIGGFQLDTDILNSAAVATASMEKEHFYRWGDAIEFSAFVSALRGVRALLAKALNTSNADGCGVLKREAAAHLVTVAGANAELLRAEKGIPDVGVRNRAQQAARLMAKQLKLASLSAVGLDGEEIGASINAIISFFFMGPLLHFIQDQSTGARQAYRRKSALIPLMSIWCPMGMDEDIWPTLQSLLSAAGAPIPGRSTPFRVNLEKKQLKDLTLFRIRLTAAGKKAALAAQQGLAGSASPALLSAPQYLLKPTAGAVGSVATAVEKINESMATSSGDTAPSSKGTLDSSDDLERDWMRFVSVFAEGLDSITFDKFLSYMYGVVLPTVVCADSTELVKLASAEANFLANNSSSVSSNNPASPQSPSAAAFWSSVSSPNKVSAAAQQEAKLAVAAAARTVKRVFWMAFQQLDLYRKDRVPLSVVMEVLVATVDEITKSTHIAEIIRDGANPSHYFSRAVPQQLLMEIAAISRQAAGKLPAYVRFNEKDQSKLLVRLRNEKIATARDTAVQSRFKDVTVADGNRKKLTDPLGNSAGPSSASSSASEIPPNYSSPSDRSSTNGSPSDRMMGGESTVTLFQFVHIIKDLVFDPLYLSAHPHYTANGAAAPSPHGSPMTLTHADERHMYWAELVAFVEMFMYTTNQARFKQMLRKR